MPISFGLYRCSLDARDRKYRQQQHPFFVVSFDCSFVTNKLLKEKKKKKKEKRRESVPRERACVHIDLNRKRATTSSRADRSKGEAKTRMSHRIEKTLFFSLILSPNCSYA